MTALSTDPILLISFLSGAALAAVFAYRLSRGHPPVEGGPEGRMAPDPWRAGAVAPLAAGLGAALMVALEKEAVRRGRWLLTLDTATVEADRLYLRLGWTAAGTIPDYALNGDGSLTRTTYYYKRLSAPGC